MRKFEMRMEESMAMHAPPPQLMDENGMLLSGDTIIGADGQVVTPGEDKTPGHAHLGASLLELYEAQALAVNPFLRTGGTGSGGDGDHRSPCDRRHPA